VSDKTIKVNGETLALKATTVAELLRTRGLAPGTRGVAVALNGAVVPRDAWQATALCAGDQVEIVRPAGGG
jgi:sulfur carrier protein